MDETTDPRNDQFTNLLWRPVAGFPNHLIQGHRHTPIFEHSRGGFNRHPCGGLVIRILAKRLLSFNGEMIVAVAGHCDWMRTL